MPDSNVTYAGDNSTTQFAIPYPYIEEDDITVALDGVDDPTFTFISSTIVEITPAPASAVVIFIKRTTDSTRIVDHQDGTTVTEATLDLDSNQVIYLAQEAADDVADKMGIDASDGKYDATSDIIKNVADGVATNDAVNKGQLDTIAGSAAAAAASAAAALVSENAVAADLVLTDADTIATAADVVTTNADVVITQADVILCEADRVSCAASEAQATIDAAAAAADLLLTDADQVSCAADAAQVAADLLLTDADQISCDADATAAAASAAAAAASAAGIDSYDVAFVFPSIPIASSTHQLTMVRAVDFAAEFAGSDGDVITVPSTGTIEIDVHKNGSTIGDIQITTGGVFTFNSDVAAVTSLVAGDRLGLVMPADLDDCEDINIVFKGTFA